MCQIGSHVIIGKGTTIGRGCDIEDHIQIEQSVTIGKRCHVVYKSIICNDASIGDDCVIGGFVGERTKIENNVRMFGSTVHSQSNPTLGWDETPDERAPEIRKWSFIGFGATIAGGITIGPQSYVLSNSLVTRRVPPKHIACGFNTIVPYEKWSGHLKESPLFKGERT